MSQMLTVPLFATEDEEVAWWEAHRAEVDAAVLDTLEKGQRWKAFSVASAIQLDAEDARRAERIAQRKGLSYEAYVRSLVHEALEREDAA